MLTIVAYIVWIGGAWFITNSRLLGDPREGMEAL